MAGERSLTITQSSQRQGSQKGEEEQGPHGLSGVLSGLVRQQGEEGSCRLSVKDCGVFIRTRAAEKGGASGREPGRWGPVGTIPALGLFPNIPSFQILCGSAALSPSWTWPCYNRMLPWYRSYGHPMFGAGPGQGPRRRELPQTCVRLSDLPFWPGLWAFQVWPADRAVVFCPPPWWMDKRFWQEGLHLFAGSNSDFFSQSGWAVSPGPGRHLSGNGHFCIFPSAPQGRDAQWLHRVLLP